MAIKVKVVRTNPHTGITSTFYVEPCFALSVETPLQGPRLVGNYESLEEVRNMLTLNGETLEVELVPES